MLSDLKAWSDLVEGGSFQCQVDGTVFSCMTSNTTLYISHDKQTLQQIDRFLASCSTKPYISLESKFGLKIILSPSCKTFEMIDSSSSSSFSIVSRSLYDMPRIIGSAAYVIIEPILVYELESWHVSLLAHQIIIKQQIKRDKEKSVTIHGISIRGSGLYCY